MLINNPFSEIATSIPSVAMKTFVVIMLLAVVGGTIFDVIHKKSAKYFFENMKKARASGVRKVGGASIIGIAAATVAHDVLASAEFCNHRRRMAHLLTMYGFILFIVTTCMMIFGYGMAGSETPAIYPLLWHLGAIMVCSGGCWFWFRIRADVAAEGNSIFRLIPADLFIVSLVACAFFALIWSFFQWVGVASLAWLFFSFFIIATLALFGGIPWSKFAHMFFKPAAALQKRIADADGSRGNLPEPADAPEKFGLGIKRSLPRNY